MHLVLSTHSMWRFFLDLSEFEALKVYHFRPVHDRARRSLSPRALRFLLSPLVTVLYVRHFLSLRLSCIFQWATSKMASET